VETGWLGDQTEQVIILTRFLQLFLQGLSIFASSASTSRNRITQLSTSLDSVFSLLPSPTPLIIYQTLISHYARSDAVELGSGPNSSLGALRAVWNRMKIEGVVKDIKTYMMCMEGLGRKGDIKGLRELWEELRVDKVCKEEWEREEREKLECELWSSSHTGSGKVQR
jgi:pentatricopeptide repeat protein